MDRREDRRGPVRRESSERRGSERERASEYDHDPRRRGASEGRESDRDERLRRRPSQSEIEKARRERMKRKAEARRRAEEPPEGRRRTEGSTESRRRTEDRPEPRRRAEEKTEARQKSPRSSSENRPDRRPDYEREERPAPKKKAGTGKKRKKRKPMSLRAKVLIAGSGIFAILAVLMFTLMFQVKQIRVEGETRYSEEEVLAACGIKMEENLLLAGKESAALIQKGLPYVRDAVVRKRLPSTVVIELSETTPKYCMEQEGKWYVLDTDLKLLERADKQPKKLMVLKGLLFDEAQLGEKAAFFEAVKVKALEELGQIFNENEITGITAIDMENSLDVRLKYEDRLVIKLGIPNDLETKVRHALAVIREKLDPKDRGMIDISGGKNATYNRNYDPETGE